jgi:putative peptidoglycan lipid II flippase
VIRNAGPAILGRGVVQLSGWLDMWLAAWLFTGAVAAIAYAQTFYMLPVSLFGMSIAAAELPEMSRAGGGDAGVLRARVAAGLRQMAVFVVPSAVGYLVLGDVILAAMYESGEFDRADTILVYLILAGYSIGLLASTASRLYSSAFYALEDTKTPARMAMVRVVASALLGGTLMILLEPVEVRGMVIRIGDGVTVMGNPIGAAGLAAGTGIAAWLEWTLLRRALRDRVGDASAAGFLARLFVAAIVAAAAARALLYVLPPLHRFVELFAALVPFGILYFGVAHVMGVAEVRRALSRVTGRLGGRRA